MTSAMEYVKPLLGRGAFKVGKILTLAVLLNLMTDACQFSEFNSFLSEGTTPSFFVSAQWGGGQRFRGGGGGRRPPPPPKQEEGENYYDLLGVQKNANE